MKVYKKQLWKFSVTLKWDYLSSIHMYCQQTNSALISGGKRLPDQKVYCFLIKYLFFLGLFYPIWIVHRSSFQYVFPRYLVKMSMFFVRNFFSECTFNSVLYMTGMWLTFEFGRKAAIRLSYSHCKIINVCILAQLVPFKSAG